MVVLYFVQCIFFFHCDVFVSISDSLREGGVLWPYSSLKSENEHNFYLITSHEDYIMDNVGLCRFS
jgi:hypothetical protein